MSFDCGCTTSSSGSIPDPDILLTGDCSHLEWCEILTPAFRAFVGDFDGTEFSSTRSCEILKAAAFYVAADLCDCPNLSFSIDVCSGAATPSPLKSAVLSNLIVLKAACMVNQGSARQKAINEGIKAVCGPATMQLASSSSAFSSLMIDGPCASYEQLKENCCFRSLIQSAQYCKIVMGPFVSDCFVPYSSRGPTDSCDQLTDTEGRGGCCG